MPAFDDTGGITILKLVSGRAFPLWVADMYLSKQKRNCMLVLALSLGAGFATLPATAQQHQQSEHHHAKQKWQQATLQADAIAEIAQDTVERKRVVEGKSVEGRVDIGGRRNTKKKK